MNTHSPARRPLSGFARIVVAPVVACAMVLLMPAQVFAAEGDPAACTPAERTGVFTEVGIEPNTDVAPGDTLTLNYSGTAPEDLCAGDWARLTVPEPLSLEGDGDAVTVTFDDVAAAGKAFSSEVPATVAPDAEAGKTYALVFNGSGGSTLTANLAVRAAEPDPAPPADAEEPAAADDPAPAADCTPQDRSDSLTSITSENGTRIDFEGLLPDDACSGDFVEVTLGADFLVNVNGQTEIKDPDGVVMGVMNVQDKVMRITFNDYVETHQDVRYEGFFTVAQSTLNLDPDSTFDVTWLVNGEVVFTTKYSTAACEEDCDAPILVETPYKSGLLHPDGTSVQSYIWARTAQEVGETIVITDEVGPGQAIDCSVSGVWKGFRSQDGTIGAGTDGAPTADIECSETKIVATFEAIKAGDTYALMTRATITRPLSSYEDSGSVRQHGTTDDVDLELTNYVRFGGSGSGNTPVPDIDVEKYDSEQGPEDGDHDETPKDLAPGAEEELTFSVTNTGDLEPMDRAEAYGALRNQGLSIADISRRTGIGSATISNYLSLLLLSEEDQERVRSGEVAPFAAIAAGRRKRQADRKRAGASRLGRPPKRPPEEAWFGEGHRLASEVRRVCGHQDPASPLWQIEVGCGPCWEAVIVADARRTISR